LDHTFARKTFAQRIGSAKVKSKSEVIHYNVRKSRLRYHKNDHIYCVP